MSETAPHQQILAWFNLKTSITWVYTGVPGQMHGISVTAGMFAWYLERGTVTARTARGEIHAQAGQWVFLASGQLDRDFSDDARITSVHFNAYWPDGRPLFELPGPLLCTGEPAAELRRATEPLRHFVQQRFPGTSIFLAREHADLLKFLEFQARTHRWLIACARALGRLGIQPTPMSEIDQRAADAHGAIEAWPPSTPFSEAGLARRVGLSVSQLNRLYVAHFGQTPRQHDQQRRTRFAQRLLSTSTVPIKRIAYDVGFKQPSHFSNWFRRKTGQTPSAYRRHPTPPSRLTV